MTDPAAQQRDLELATSHLGPRELLNDACRGSWHIHGCTHRRERCGRCTYTIMLALPDDDRWGTGEWQPGETVWLDDSGRRSCNTRAPFGVHKPTRTGLVPDGSSA